MPLLTLLWGSQAKKITTVCTALAAVFGVIVGIGPALSALDGWNPLASKWYVDTKVHPVELAQADTTRAVDRLLLQQLQSSLYAAKLDQQKAPSQTVDERVDQLQREITQTQAKINAGH